MVSLHEIMMEGKTRPIGHQWDVHPLLMSVCQLVCDSTEFVHMLLCVAATVVKEPKFQFFKIYNLAT